MWRARTSSSSGAVPPSGRSGSRSSAPGRSAWTSRSASWITPAAAMDDAGVDFPLIHASAEAVPLPDASFDIVFCDHGAMTFADPYRTVPEAARLLRPGGLFAFNQGSAIADVLLAGGRRCADRAPGHRLLRAVPDRARRRGRLPAPVRRVDPPVPRERLHRRGPHRAASARRTRRAPTAMRRRSPGPGAGRPSRSGGCVGPDRGERARPHAAIGRIDGGRTIGPGPYRRTRGRP